jgi:sugar (pentulose or hexulose) kinase
MSFIAQSGGSDPLWIGIDLGTQSIRAVAVTESGLTTASVSRPLESVREHTRHTQDPVKWWTAVCACCQSLVRQVDPARMQGLAIAATSGTVLLTDDHLKPVTAALMYDDSRAAQEASQLRELGSVLWEELGYTIQPSWAIAKLLWLVRHTSTHEARNLRLAHQNDFINQRFSGRPVATDWSHSLKTGYDVLQQRWPLEIFEAAGLPPSLFPEVVSPGALIGSVCSRAAAVTGFPEGLPILAGMTDGCAAQIASGATGVGSWNSVLGTTLVLKGVTEKRLRDPLRVMYSHRSADGRWLPGGASSSGAGVLTRDLPGADLARLSLASESEEVSPVVIYPLVSRGERFPFYAPDAVGFRLGTPKDDGELYRAILQGISLMERLSFDYLEMLGAPIGGSLTISGGAVRSEYLNRLRASVLARPLFVVESSDSAHGMAVLAASSRSSLQKAVSEMVHAGRCVRPELDFASTYGELYDRLLTTLVDRGWLSEDVAAFALARANSAGVNDV